VSLEQQIVTAVGGKGFALHPLSAELPRNDPMVTYLRRPNQQEYELSGTRGLNRAPVAFVCWSQHNEHAVSTALDLIALLEAYTSPTVLSVEIAERSATYDSDNKLHGFRVVAEFITTED
jgi:hypothetical protein